MQRTEPAVERWGVCDYCRRQFYIDREMADSGSRVACPACGASPMEIRRLVQLNSLIAV